MRVIWNLLFGSLCVLVPGYGTDCGPCTGQGGIRRRWRLGGLGKGRSRGGGRVLRCRPGYQQQRGHHHIRVRTGFLQQRRSERNREAVRLHFQVPGGSLSGFDPNLGGAVFRRLRRFHRRGGNAALGRFPPGFPDRNHRQRWRVDRGDPSTSGRRSMDCHRRGGPAGSGGRALGRVAGRGHPVWRHWAVPGTGRKTKKEGISPSNGPPEPPMDGSHDYIPDGDTYFEIPWGPVDLRISTAVESQGWGRIKREEWIGGQE